ncbi:MAG: hypothetical protein ABR540_06380 [Acidimicrobiales bacterium]
MRQCEANVAATEQAVDKRARWDGTHAWRLGDVARIQAELDHCRASATLGAVRQSDPLVFGIERLRGARSTYFGDLSALEAALPPDRSRELAGAKARVAADRRLLADARVRRDQAEQALAVAQERHWGRKDKTAIRSATGRLDHAQDVVKAAESALARHAKELAAERASAKERDAAIAIATPERARLVSLVHELDMALDTTRPERVVAIATAAEPPEPVVQALGPVPASGGGQRVWCALASEMERDRDRGVWRDPIDHAGRHGIFARMYDGEREASERPDDLVRLGAEADPVAATVTSEPGAWERQLEDARDIIHFARTVERPGLDLELGL